MAIYATTDWHGIYEIYEKVKSKLQPDDTVVYLGDANDRGPNGWKLIKAIYNDPQFEYYKGNHEDMLINTLKLYFKKPRSYMYSIAYSDLCHNGGLKTFQDWIEDGANPEWIEKLENLPLHKEYLNNQGQLVLLSHAGYTPWTAENNPNILLIPSIHDLLWDRTHFYDDYNEEDCMRNSIIVHGHTRIESLLRRLNIKVKETPIGAYWYNNNNKVCIDNSSAYSGKACLLNLDTWEEIIIG